MDDDATMMGERDEYLEVTLEARVDTIATQGYLSLIPVSTTPSYTPSAC
ncbi:hypothetical protein [Natrinema sp. CBA1119]